MTSTKMTIAAKKQWVLEQLNTKRNVELAVMAIFNRQTADEQRTDSTNNNNSMGFNGTDAQFGSSLAKSILNYGKLSDKQAEYAKKVIAKYWKQLIEVAEAKAASTGRGGAPWARVAVQAAAPKCEGCGKAAGFETDDGRPACSTCLDLTGRILTKAEIDAQEDERENYKNFLNRDDFGCPHCGCPEFHDGEVCPNAPEMQGNDGEPLY